MTHIMIVGNGDRRGSTRRIRIESREMAVEKEFGFEIDCSNTAAMLDALSFLKTR